MCVAPRPRGRQGGPTRSCSSPSPAPPTGLGMWCLIDAVSHTVNMLKYLRPRIPIPPSTLGPHPGCPPPCHRLLLGLRGAVVRCHSPAAGETESGGGRTGPSWGQHSSHRNWGPYSDLGSDPSWGSNSRGVPAESLYPPPRFLRRRSEQSVGSEPGSAAHGSEINPPETRGGGEGQGLQEAEAWGHSAQTSQRPPSHPGEGGCERGAPRAAVGQQDPGPTSGRLKRLLQMPSGLIFGESGLQAAGPVSARPGGRGSSAEPGLRAASRTRAGSKSAPKPLGSADGPTEVVLRVNQGREGTGPARDMQVKPGNASRMTSGRKCQDGRRQYRCGEMGMVNTRGGGGQVARLWQPPWRNFCREAGTEQLVVTPP